MEICTMQRTFISDAHCDAHGSRISRSGNVVGDNKCLQTNILRIHRQCRTQRNVHVHVHVPSFLFTSSAMRPPIHPVFPPKIRTFVMGAGSVEEDMVGTGSMRLMKRAVSAMAQWHGPTANMHAARSSSHHHQRKAQGVMLFPFRMLKGWSVMRPLTHVRFPPHRSPPLISHTSQTLNDTAQFSFSCRYLLSLLRS